MKMRLLILCLLCGSAFGQGIIGNGMVQYVSSAPSGTCGQNSQMQVVFGAGSIWTCASGTWTQIAAGGGGSVTSIATTAPITGGTITTTGTIGCASCLINNGVNTGTAAVTLDLSSSTVANAFKVPIGAGLTSGADGVLVYDTTAKLSHQRTNSADSISMAVTSTDTTTTHAAFASAVAGIWTSRAIATGDLPTAIPIGNIGSAGLSGTAPITISAAGAIGCATCVTSAASLTSTAIMTGGGSQASQTPSATATLDSSGNMLLPGTLGVTGTTTATAVTMSGVLTNSQAGALSAASVSITGAPVTGGTGTTNFPLVYLNSGTAPTTFNTSGTLLGFNAPSGFAGNFIDTFLNGGTRLFTVTSAGSVISVGAVTLGASSAITFNGRSAIKSSADGLIQLTNNAGTAFTRLGFGGSTSSFTALCTTATLVTACLGDGTAGTFTFSSPGYIDTSIGVTTAAMGAQSTATCTNITNMTWTIAANKNYKMHCAIPITFASSATVAFCVGGPGSPTSHTINAIGNLGAAAAYADINLVNSATYGTKTTASGAVGASTQVILLDAVIRNGATASGTALTLQTAANGTNNITILADAACDLTQTN